jgi:hypothetical protein
MRTLFRCEGACAAVHLKSLVLSWMKPMDETVKTRKAREPDISLHQAKRLCQLPEKERLVFIAEGLPIILDSEGFGRRRSNWASIPARQMC